MESDPLDKYDTPTARATITQATVDELDDYLEGIRKRRLVLVQKLEATARVKADSVRLTAFLKLESAIKTARKSLGRLDEQIERTEKVIHKCRLLAMAAQMEVEMEDADSESA